MAKVCGMNKKVWIIIFLLLQILTLTLILLLINNDRWFYQKRTYNGHMIEKFKGKLLHPRTSLSICSENETYKDCYEKCQTYCARFHNWYYAGTIYVAIDSLVIGFCIVNSVFLLIDYLNIQLLRSFFNLYTTAFFMVLILIFHFLALTIWANIVKLDYENCFVDENFEVHERVCPDQGFSLSLGLLVFLGIVNPFYYLVAFRLKGTEDNVMDGDIGLVFL